MKTICRNLILQAIFCLFTLNSFSQYVKYTNPNVVVNGQSLKNPWAGGLNSAMFNTIDLNGDGLKDLFLFDKQNLAPYRGYHKIRTFLNMGTANTVDYKYAPQYESKFPQNLAEWVLLVDYDCDGKEDIFTYTNLGGMAVYHNDYTAGNGLSFSLAYSLVNSMFLGGSYANLYVSNVNQPVLKDVNGDGDLDVLTVTLIGGAIEYHENYAQENYGRCDTLVYVQRRQCWGHVGLSSFKNTAVFNPSDCLFFTQQGDSASRNNAQHSGSCMIGFDQNGDGDIDLLNGDLLGNNLLFMENSGVPGVTDSIISQDTLFPQYDIPTLYTTFPSPYYFDADNDGVNDIVVSSCSELYSENYNNNLFYKNIGSNTNHQFHYTKNRFLTDEMIDVGSGSNITFFDVDADGKQDLLIGNYGYFVSDSVQGHQESCIAYYRNTSSGNTPEFTWMTNDFANLRQYLLTAIKPTFADLDNDGDIDLLIGNSAGNLYYFVNNGSGQYSLAPNGVNYQSIDVGTYSAPQLTDVDGDNLPDLLIGETYGAIFYYRNTGNATTPVFTYVTNHFGGVDVRNPAVSYFGYSNPKLYVENGQHKLLVGSEVGRLFLYDNIDGNLGGTFNLLDTFAFGIHEPYRITFDVADLNNDTFPEIITGSFAGGISYYSKATPVVVIDTNPKANNLLIYPNPATESLTFEFIDSNVLNGSYTIYDVRGRLVTNDSFTGSKKTLSLHKYAKGFYTLRIITTGSLFTRKIIVR